MAERETTRDREAEARSTPLYDEHFQRLAAAKAIRETGKVVVKGKGLPWEQNRQAIGKWYLHPNLHDRAIEIPRAPLLRMFMQEIRTHSGRHRHQGGLALFVLQGRGYTVADGKRYDWKEGDLILLPVKPGGIEHQHFNLDPDVPARWLSLIPQLMFELLGIQLEQKEEHPDWKGGAPSAHWH